MNRFLMFGAALTLLSSHLFAAPEVAVSMRYYQDTGVSRAHIYLYREDGKLLRQLTDSKRDDVNPLFSPDGSVIVFTQCSPDGSTYWSIEPLGHNLKQLSSAPDWYLKVMAVGHPTNSDTYLNDEKSPSDLISTKEDKDQEVVELHYRLPDGGELVIHNLDSSESPDKSEPTSSYTVIDTNKTSHVFNTNIRGILADLDFNDTTHFLYQPQDQLEMFFVEHHLDSTDGSQMVAFDLKDYTVHELESLGHDLPGGKMAAPGLVFPTAIPGESAFLSWTGVRFIGYGTQGKTENSSYLERWDSTLHQINYSQPGAGQCYGGSLYRADQKPNVIWLTWQLPKNQPPVDPKGLVY